MQNTLLFVGLLVLVSAVADAGPQGERKSNPLKTPFGPPLTTVLAAGGKAQATVLIPLEAQYARAARDFVQRVRQISGTKLPTAEETASVKATPPTKTFIVFGNFATGPLALRLYANKLICSDGMYPGDNGYELRTIPLALDTGANVLFMGGSSPRAVAQAMQVLFRTLKPGRDVSVPFTLQWVCSSASKPRPVTEEGIAKAVASARKALTTFRIWQKYRTACGATIRAARDYHLSGDDSHGRLYARLVDLLASHYRQKKENPPTFILHGIVMALDQVEESSGLTDADRLKAAEWIRQMVEDTMAFWEMRDPIRRYDNHELRPIWNHETHPALGVAHAAQYLKARYHVPAADYWEAVVDNLFAGQITCDQPLEDSANYQWSVPHHTLEYVLATGRLHEYFTGGALNDCMEYAIASHDGEGNEATHGDAWQPFGSCAGGLFAIATAHYKDPRYQWILERIGRRRHMWGYCAKIDAAVPSDHIGLRVFSVHPARVEGYGIKGIRPELVLDKAVFRSGWEPEADYMMLDGLNVGNHKHVDANAIIRFSANRRYWLVDMDYIRAAPKHHNSIAVVRDGKAPDQSPASNRDAQVIAEPPFAAEIVHAAGSADRAVTQSLLTDYNGLDWNRSIFWKAKDFFVVVDRLTARSPGNYIARCFWHTLGNARLDGSVLQVTQKDNQHFFVVNGDGSRLKLRDSFDYGHGGQDGYYARYAYADKITRALVQTKSKSLRRGETLEFANLFYVRGGSPGRARELRRVNKDTWMVTGGHPVLVGFGPQLFGKTKVKRGMFILAEDQLLTAEARGITRDAKPSRPVGASLVLGKLARESTPARAPEDVPVPKARGMSVVWRMDLKSPVTALAARGPGILCGTESGAVVLANVAGNMVWHKDFGSRVRTVAFASFPKDRQVCAIGTHAGDVKALDAASGNELWSYTCQPFHGRTGSVATVFAADLNGDKSDEIVAGSDNWHYHGLSSAGKLLWRTDTTHASTAGAAGDCSGNGKHDVAAGTEYYWSRLLDSSGRVVGKPSGGPVASAAAVFDTNGDGKAEAFFGMEDCFVRCVGSNRAVVWKTNVGGAPTAIQPMDIDGNGKPEIICSSEGFSVYALRADGGAVWRTELPESVNGLAIGDRCIAAACDDGRAYLLDGRGRILKSALLPAPPTSVKHAGANVFAASSGNLLVAFDATE